MVVARIWSEQLYTRKLLLVVYDLYSLCGPVAVDQGKRMNSVLHYKTWVCIMEETGKLQLVTYIATFCNSYAQEDLAVSRHAPHAEKVQLLINS